MMKLEVLAFIFLEKNLHLLLKKKLSLKLVRICAHSGGICAHSGESFGGKIVSRTGKATGM